MSGMRLGRSAGLTLVELLAAMMVLLVGVYAVAVLFPQLSRNIAEEGRRTSMSRTVEGVVAGFTTGTHPVPAAISPRWAHINVVDPNSRPDDPDTTDLDDNPPNSRDDLVQVYGEEFVVPAPASTGGYPVYVPRMGLLDVNRTPTVVELRDLVEAYRDPGPTGTIRRGEYYLRADGQLRLHAGSGVWQDEGGEVWRPGTSWALVDYDWHDGGVVQRVRGELVQAGQYVQAVTDYGGSVVPGYTRVQARWVWDAAIGAPTDVTLPNDRAQLRVVLDERAGQALYFPPYAVGRKLRIDYRVRTLDYDGGVNHRRAPIMWEDKRIPESSPYQLQLTFSNIDDENPLFSTNQLGVALEDPEWILVVDLLDGTPIVSQSTTGVAGWDYLRGLRLDGDEQADRLRDLFERGRVWLEPTEIWERRGRPVRVYYRTMDQHMVQVQRAPAEFVARVDGVDPRVPQWQHRSYYVGTAPSLGVGLYTTLYGFPAYCEDHTVQVNYVVDRVGRREQISNEMHVISYLGSGYGFGFVLNEPDVQGVLAVEGTSMRVTGWWRTETGRISRVDVTSVVFPWSQ